MPGRITWQDTEEIALQLLEKYPDVDPFSVRFTDLHKWVTSLPGFDDDKTKNAESMLEQIQLKWNEEKMAAEE
ncbi:MAG: Fe-S cluster assembly protein IscX [Tepidisphaerales bacterium]